MESPSSPPGPVRTCPSCNNQVEPGHKFCETCGTKMEDRPTCKKCGAQFIAPVKFCELCGTPVITDEKNRQVVEKPQEAESLPCQEPYIPEPEGPEPAPVPVTQEPPRQKAAAEKILPPATEPEPAPPKKMTIKTPVNKALILGGIIVFLVVIAGAYFIGLPMLIGNSTGQADLVTAAVTPNPVPVTANTPEVTVIPTTVPATQANSLVPLPTQLPPSSQEFFYLVQKDPVDAKITLLFQGGPGINSISNLEMKVTHQDGTTLNGSIKPLQGVMEVTLDGSKETDRVEVIARMFNGKSYRVFDELMVYKSR
jgi:hypothetical protein